jgi:hypothetical protein
VVLGAHDLARGRKRKRRKKKREEEKPKSVERRRNVPVRACTFVAWSAAELSFSSVVLRERQA